MSPTMSIGPSNSSRTRAIVSPLAYPPTSYARGGGGVSGPAQRDLVLPIELLEVADLERPRVQVHDGGPQRPARAGGDAHGLHHLEHVARVADAVLEQRPGLAVAPAVVDQELLALLDRRVGHQLVRAGPVEDHH